MIHGQCSCAQLFSSWCTSLLVQVYKQVSGEASERQATCCPTPEYFLQLRVLVQLGRPSNALLFKACRAQGGQPDQLSLCPWEDSSCPMSVNRSVIALSLFACIPNMDVMPFHGPTEASWICMIRKLVTWTEVHREKIFLWHFGKVLPASTAVWKKYKVWNVNCFIEGKIPKMQFYFSVVFTAMCCWNVYFCKFTFKAFFHPGKRLEEALCEPIENAWFLDLKHIRKNSTWKFTFFQSLSYCVIHFE